MDPSTLSFHSLTLNDFETIPHIQPQQEELEIEIVEEKHSTSNPHFFPPLWLARRSKICEILKEEGIGSVADLGCGQGAVLQILSTPASHLDDFPSIYPPSPISKSPLSTSHSSSSTPLKSSKERIRNILLQVPLRAKSEGELHLRRLVGIDVDRVSLESAIKVTEPIERSIEGEEEGEFSWRRERERWEELRVEIYLGSAFEVYNEALVGLDAMFATEVIEHLSPTSLAKVSSMILGVYQPRIFIVTTPNHEFNAYFPSSSTHNNASNRRSRGSNSSPNDEEEEDEEAAIEESGHRFPDPTLRTKRIFRDSDHQFEWTQIEFQTWANQAAKENDYTVSFTGVGNLAGYFGLGNKIPLNPPSLDAHPELKEGFKVLENDGRKFFATQIAVFKRHYSQEVERIPRSHSAIVLPFLSSPSSTSTSPIITVKDLPSIASPTTSSSSSPPPLKSAKLTSSLSLTPHLHLKTHVHSPHPSIQSEMDPPSPSIILNLMSKLSIERFNSPRVSLRDYWNQDSIRLIAQGRIGALVEAVLESGEGKVEGEGEVDEWDFYLIENGGGGGGGGEGVRELRGEEALGILWKGFPSVTLERRERGGYTEDDEEDDGEEQRRREEQEEEEQEKVESEESDQEWRARADEFLVDDFDQVEETTWGLSGSEQLLNGKENLNSSVW